ncbi:MAG: NigD-like C-terminal domain-containing protein [Bacteroidales bacterium]
MRKLFSYSLLLATALFITSCDNNDDWDLPQGYTFATVMEDSEDETIYFMMDNDESFVVTNNKTNIDLEKLEIGDRVVAGVTLVKDESAIYDYTADLYVVYMVRIGESVVVSTEEESDEIPDDKLSYVVSNISLTRGYLNLLAGYLTDNVEDVKFYLVENLVSDDETDETSEEGEYLNLELRYDNAYQDGNGNAYESYVSFDMESYRDRLEDMDGVKLRINTLKSGVITVTIKSYKLYE